MTIGLTHYLLLAALLFAVGLYGFLAKRNAIAMLMSIELMLNAVNINFVAFNRFAAPEVLTGQLVAVFAIAVAAAEVAVGFALIFRMYRDRFTVNTDELDRMER